MPVYESWVSIIHYILSRPRHSLRRGTGRPTVLLVHGAGLDLWSWPPQVRRLADTMVYAVDLPGHGQSGGQARASIQDYAQDLHDFVRHEGITAPVLVGHSMGGAIALSYALAHPHRLRGLGLISTGARLAVAPALLEMLRTDPRQAVRQIVAWAYGPHADPGLVSLAQERMQQVDPQVIRQDFLACDRFDVRERLDEIQVPALVLCGSQDRMTPPPLSQYLADHLPHSRYHTVDGVGHMLPLEAPQEVAQYLAHFLDELASSST